jgi:hypothetical protein
MSAILACPIKSPAFAKVQAAVGYMNAAMAASESKSLSPTFYERWDGQPSYNFNLVKEIAGELAAIKTVIFTKNKAFTKWYGDGVKTPAKEPKVQIIDGKPQFFNGTEYRSALDLGGKTGFVRMGARMPQDKKTLKTILQEYGAVSYTGGKERILTRKVLSSAEARLITDAINNDTLFVVEPKKFQNGWTVVLLGQQDLSLQDREAPTETSTEQLGIIEGQVRTHPAGQLRMFEQEPSDPTQTDNPPVDTNADMNKALEAVRQFLINAGVTVNKVESIINRYGNSVPNAEGRANITKLMGDVRKSIDLVMGKAGKEVVNEEVAHIFVAMLPETAATYQSMYRKVTEYPIYKELSENMEMYQLSNEKEVREEAMARVIADQIGTFTDAMERDGLRTWTYGWLEKAIAYLKNKFSTLLAENPFARSAYNIISGDITLLTDSREMEMYHMSSIQERVVNSVRKSNQDYAIQEIDNAELAKAVKAKKKTQGKVPMGFTGTTSRYVNVATGEVVTSRVTDPNTVEWRRNMGAKIEEFEADPNNAVASEVGTVLHDYAMQVGEWAANKGPKPKFNPIVSPEVGIKIQARVEELIDQARKLQNDLDPNGTPTFLFEHTIYDPITDVGGSIDMLVVFSDGSVAIYDYKFMTGMEVVGYGENMRFSANAGISELKIRGFDRQISDYKRILKSHYGVKNIRQSRVVPGAVKLKEQFTQKSSPDKKFNDMGWRRFPEIRLFDFGQSTLTDILPVAGETTGNVKIDQLLTSYLTLRDNLMTKKKQAAFGSPAYERITTRLESINNAIRNIQKNKSVESILRDTYVLVSRVERDLGINDQTAPNYMDTAEINGARESLDLFISSIGVLQDMIAANKNENEALFNKQTGQLRAILLKASTTKSALLEKQAERIEDATGIDVTKAAAQLGWWGRNMQSMFQFTQPIFRAFGDLVKKSINETKRKMFDVVKEVEGAVQDLEAWGKTVGKSGMSLYDPLYNKETGNLYGEFSKDFYAQRKKARETKDIKWFTSTYEQTAEDKARFEAEKKKRFAIIEKHYKDEIDPETEAKVSLEWKRTQMKTFWLRKYDLSLDAQKNPVYPDAWTNPEFLYASVKNREQWQSNEYKYIQSVPALKNFYNMYLKYNTEFREFLPAKISKNFVANVRKDAIDVIADNGLGAIKGIKNSFIESFQVMEEDKEFGMIDPFTGNVTPSIPTFYTKPIFNSEGKVDLDNKSRDLGRNLIMFAQMAYNYKHMSEVEQLGLSIRSFAQSDKYKELLTDAYGNAIINPNTGARENKQAGPQTIEALNNFISYYVYGIRTREKDIAVEIAGKKYSAFKGMKAMMRYVSAKALSLNFLSAGANLAAASASGYMEGVKNIHYNTKNYRKGYQRVIKKDTKLYAAFEFLQIAQEDMSYLKSLEVSVSKAVKTFTFDKLFVLHRKGDDLVDMAITSAILESKGFDSDGNLVDAGGDVKSVYDSMSIQGDKLSLENLSQEQFTTLRNYIRYVASTTKGNMSSENVSAQKNSILFQAAMQFRSWLPRMAEERFSKLRYNPDIETYEIGRYRAFFNQFTAKTFLPALGDLIKNLTALNLQKIKGNPDLLRLMLAEAREKNPDLEITEEEFIKLMESQTKALVMEIRVILSTILPLLLFGGLFSDDEEEDPTYVKQLLKTISRTQSELTFFLVPTSTLEIINTPIPSLSVLTDLTKLVSNTFDEGRDMTIGENSNRDKTPQFYYTFKFLPSVYGLLRTVDFFEQPN